MTVPETLEKSQQQVVLFAECLWETFHFQTGDSTFCQCHDSSKRGDASAVPVQEIIESENTSEELDKIGL